MDPSKQMVTDSKGNTNNVMVVEDRVAKCLREVSKTDIKGWNGFKSILSMSMVIINAVALYLPQIQDEREKLLNSVEATWSPSGLGLNLCPASISTTSIPTSITSS